MDRSTELEQLVARWFEAASRGDADMVDVHVSLDPRARLIGSDTSEWLAGGATIAEFLRGEVTGAAGRARFEPEGTEAFEEGTVGWATTRLTITLPGGQTVRPRWSAVFHREDGTWRFVQTHASIGIGNVEAGWTYRQD
jgi:ketosteroid isomerase-like protein